MSRIAYLDCVGGIAGDMLLAALVDAGASPRRLDDVAPALGVVGVSISFERVTRHGIGALRARVQAGVGNGRAEQARPYAEIRRLVEASTLPDRARQLSLDAFRRLAEAEGAIHGVNPDDVHFHEVGGVDAIIDICGAMLLLGELGVDEVACSPLPYSRGIIPSAHGILPAPAPATLALLRGAPLVGVATEAELVTPTGAAIAATVVGHWGTLPPLVLDAVGYGAGKRDLPDRPNLLRIVLGATSPRTGDVVVLETNLDDFLPELVPDAVERCFAGGALDVWTTPTLMKKGRPGIVLSVLARPGDEAALARAMLQETSALGVRVTRLERYELDRELRQVSLEGGTVRVKIGRLDGRVVNVAPEHDDCATVARTTGRSVKSVWAAALAAAEQAT